MRRLRLRYEFLLLAPCLLDLAAVDQFIGDFSAALDRRVYQLSISGFARGRYDGECLCEGERLALDTWRFGDRILGQIGIAENRSGFIGQIQDGHLLLRYEDGGVILLKRISGAAQP